MQLATNADAKTANAQNQPVAASAGNESDSGYVGKHRPHRLSLRPRVRVSQLAERETASKAS
jgi:hypothetical protein